MDIYGDLYGDLYRDLIGIYGWLVVSTLLKNDGVRQLGLLFPTYGKIIQMYPNVPSHQPACV